MFSYSKINNIVGWLVFFVASAVYIATLEPTASYWDCGEFIAVSRNLMTPHPPGAPLFLLIGRLFSLLASDDSQVAYMINMVSALSSAFTILFLFWSITLISRKLVGLSYKDVASKGQIVAIMGAGIVGSLAYTFSDSFWFSAVEAEVYALSAFFTAIVVWLILKWETIANEPGSDRYLILIAYMVGLSIGVHLLNLLAIPAIAFVYYFRKYESHSWKGGIATFFISAGVLLLIQEGVIVMLPTIAGKFEMLFVNGLGMPFNTGSIIFGIIVFGAMIFGIAYTAKHKKHLLNTALLSLAFVIIGYGSYAMIIIRSNQDPTIDENNPEDVLSFVSYLKREQYGDRPLIYGPQFTANVIDYDGWTPQYTKGKDTYEIYDYKPVYKYDPNHTMLLPRLHSQQPHHVKEYKELLKEYGGWREGQKPNGRQNMTYMFDRQMGKMYWRYFLWNFVGREGDIQDSGVLWDGSDVPDLLDSTARNSYYALPLILGLLGLVFQFMKDKKSFIVVLSLFFFTGLAIILWLNAPPIEPRERDYAYAGSYYAFCFFIGFGVIAIYDMLLGAVKKVVPAAIIATIIGLIVPGIMVAEGWDDHDRSGRYHSLDSAINLLQSCAPNAILFTGGDNDTFPLWYAQEVEKIRRDVRVCNLSLLNTDWYIDQMKRSAYESEPLPITFERDDYIQGINDYLRSAKNIPGAYSTDKALNIDKFLQAVKSKNKLVSGYRDIPEVGFKKYESYLPSNKFTMSLDSSTVANIDWVPERYKRIVLPELQWTVGNGIDKKDLMILDMINNISKDGWKRPIYFSTTLGGSSRLGLDRYMMLEGLAFRLTPYPIARNVHGGNNVNDDVMFDNMMNKFQWRGLADSTISYNEFYDRFTFNERLQFLYLAQSLKNHGDTTRAKQALLKSLEVMPEHVHHYDNLLAPEMASLLYDLGEEELAKSFMLDVSERLYEAKIYLGRGANYNNYDRILDYMAENSRKMNDAELTAKLNSWAE